MPTSFEVPQFLVRDDCTVRALRSDGVHDPGYCYKTCADPPFLMMSSWQAPAAWWLCDLSVSLCRYTAQTLVGPRTPMLRDFVDSTAYFAKVVEFEPYDPDFVAAHRLCAFFDAYQIGFALASLALLVLLLPPVVVAIAEVLGGAFVLLMQASASEAAHDAAEL